MFRTALLAAVVPLALGSEYSYTYDYTDAPTAAPTSSMAPTRTDTYAPTRMTEAPSYAPTTETYAQAEDVTLKILGEIDISCPPLS